MMRTSETIVVPAVPAVVFDLVARLDTYPGWLGLVHAAEIVPAADPPTWSVELRARLGPLARSKRLRMTRTVSDPDRLVVFERDETDGRQHARWALRAELAPEGPSATRLTMHLAYDGALWTGGVLERVLDDEIRRGRVGLIQLVGDAPPA